MRGHLEGIRAASWESIYPCNVSHILWMESRYSFPVFRTLCQMILDNGSNISRIGPNRLCLGRIEGRAIVSGAMFRLLRSLIMNSHFHGRTVSPRNDGLYVGSPTIFWKAAIWFFGLEIHCF